MLQKTKNEKLEQEESSNITINRKHEACGSYYEK